MKIDKDGIPWFQAPLPRRWHRCKPHTTGVCQSSSMRGTLVERCPCGGIRLSVFGNRGSWLERNTRAKE